MSLNIICWDFFYAECLLRIWNKLDVPAQRGSAVGLPLQSFAKEQKDFRLHPSRRFNLNDGVYIYIFVRKIKH